MTASGRTCPRPVAWPCWRSSIAGRPGSRHSTGLAADDAIDRDLVLGRLAAMRFDAETLRDDATDPMTWVYAAGRRPVLPPGPRLRPAGRAAGERGRTAGGDPVGARCGAVRAGRQRPDRPVGRFQTETAIGAAGGRRLADRRRARAGGGGRGRGSGRRRDRAAPGRGRRDGTGGRWRPSGRTCATSSCRRAMARAAWAVTCSPRRCATRCSRTTLTPERILAQAEREFTAVRAEMVRLARDLWPAWQGSQPLPDDDQAIVRGVLDAVAVGAPARGRQARLLPRRERADRGVLPRDRPRRPERRTAGHPVDAGVPARLRERDAHRARSARARPRHVLRDHADPGRLVRGAARVRPPRGQRPDAPAHHDPRGRAGPLPPGARTPTGVRPSPGRCSAAACSPRAGPCT